MSKVLAINTCNECYHRELNTSGNVYYCTQMDKKLRSSKIPRWCPLDDFRRQSTIRQRRQIMCSTCKHWEICGYSGYGKLDFEVECKSWKYDSKE